ncbi:condensin [Neoconidiobolus thromboides FSU 785]|nr:condensin [Neoconidiobolus thromboides FSU 785]
MYTDFNLGDELIKFDEKSMVIEEEIDIENSSKQELLEFINKATDKLSSDYLKIASSKIFDGLRSIIKNLLIVSPAIMDRAFDMILSGAQDLIKSIEDSLKNGVLVQKEELTALNLYSFLLYIIINYAESKQETEKSTKAMNSRGNRNQRQQSHSWDWLRKQGRLFEIVYKIATLPLKKVFSSNYQVETITRGFVKSMFSILQSTDNLKNQTTRIKSYHIIAICAKDYNHNLTTQTFVSQTLQYFENLHDPIAELLEMMVNEYDYTRLAEEVLSDMSKKEFTIKDKYGPKSYSSFLVRFCELCPKTVNKYIGILIKQLDSECYHIRSAIIEVVGILIIEMVNEIEKEGRGENNESMVDRYFDILEERFKDNHYLVRSKVLQVCGRITELKAKFPKRRPRLIHLTIGRLEDKSVIVRKNAIKTLTKFMKSHPFLIDGGSLSYELLERKYNGIMEELQVLNDHNMSNQIQFKIRNEDSTEEEKFEGNDSTEMEMLDNGNPEMTNKFLQLKMKQRYYEDAVFFVKQLMGSFSSLSQLLASTHKLEAIDAMDFFVEAYHYKLKEAEEGIRNMIHLVWTKENSDENKGTIAKVKENFYNLYFTVPTASNERERINLIAKNLIDLTQSAKMADLVSLEELVRLLTIDGRFSSDLIEKLWLIYSYSKTDQPITLRRGAIILLSMIGKANHEVIKERVDLLIKIGLGDIGKDDFIVAKYSCIALQCIGGAKGKKVKGVVAVNKRLAITESIFEKLKDLLEIKTEDYHWFDMAEQVINTMYDLAQRPDKLCQSIVKNKTLEIKRSIAMEDKENKSDPWPLSQLIFLVGHIAIKQIVFLEEVEIEQKHIKSNQKADQSEMDLENVASTVEDELTEFFHRVRERGLLFDSLSLLRLYGDMIVNICSNNKVYDDKMLQIVSTLSLAKLMCISSEFCDNHLTLLLAILENSSDPIVRSNIMIALGDIATCFNSLMGENMEYMYKRLKDNEPSVKKNSLMVLTHLILNGMVKVKGQIGEMAKCIVDKDIRISNLSKLFFTELATKDNAIYNNLPDILSHLTKPEGRSNLSKEDFRSIMRFLFDFIKDKDRQCENVVDKLCQRLRHLEDKGQWCDLGYCLTLIPYKSEKTFKKLVEHFPLYQDKVLDNTFYKHLTDIVTKARHQTWQKTEGKVIIDEFELDLKKCRKKVDYDENEEETEEDDYESESTFMEDDIE